MDFFKKTIAPVLLTGLWINISESIRWVLFIKSYWIEHFHKKGMVFLEGPVNLAVWMIWGFLFAIIIFILSKKFSVMQAALLSWAAVFIMMWIVLWNTGILPDGMLWIAGPLSLFETYIGAFICKKLSAGR